MNGARVRPQRRLDQCVDLQVALGGGRRADQVSLVREGDVECSAVGLRIDRDGSEPELSQRTKDADRDLAAIRDENAVEGVAGHGGPYSPVSCPLPIS